MLASTVKPILELQTNDHLCPRCGIIWTVDSTDWKPTAPCRDCRSAWAREGVTFDEYRRNPKRNGRARKGIAA